MADLELVVPRCFILATSVFDQFMDSNGLFRDALNAQSDLEVERLFAAAELPYEVTASLRSFLEERRQRVEMSGGRRSAWASTTCGVPQGSVLAPLLFAVYTRDLHEHITTAEVVQYADDVTDVVRAAGPVIAD